MSRFKSDTLSPTLLFSIVVFLTVLLFSQTLNYGFVQDDRPHILENQLLKGDAAWKQIWTEGLYPGNLYRPITLLSYLGTWKFLAVLNIDSPKCIAAVFHGTNIFLFLACLGVSFLFVRKIFNEKVAFVCCIFFALHPLHYEVVANVSARSELLSFLFGMLGLLLSFAPKTGKAKLLIASSLFLLSSLSKESGILFPVLGGLCAFFFSKKEGIHCSRFFWPGTFAIGAAIAFRYLALGSLGQSSKNISFVDNPLINLDTLDRVLSAIALLGKYLFEICFPFQLRSEYRFAELQNYWGPWNQETWWTLAFCFASIVLLVLGIRKKHPISFCLAWFFLSFGITSNILFPIGTFYAERLSFLPGFGIVLGGAIFFSRFRFPVVFALGIAAVWTVSNTEHLLRWKSERRFFERALQESSRSVPALSNAAVYYRNRGDLEKAKSLVERALRIYPDFVDAQFVQASIVAQAGELPKAQQLLEDILKKRPDFTKARAMLGRIFLQQKNYTRAEYEFLQASKQRGTAVEGLLGLYALALLEGDSSEIQRLGTLLKDLDPTNEDFLRLSPK